MQRDERTGTVIGESLARPACKCKHYLGTALISYAVDLTIVGSKAVSTVITVDDFLTKLGTLGVFCSACPKFRIEEKTHLQHSVHTLVHAEAACIVTFLYGEIRIAIIKLGGDEIPNFLTPYIEIGVGRAGHFTTDCGVQGNCATPYLEVIVVNVCTHGAHFGYILFEGILRHTDGCGIDSLKVADDIVAEADGFPCLLPCLADDLSFRVPRLA